MVLGVTVACPVGPTGQPSSVTLSKGSALGTGTYTPTCDGTQHPASLTVFASQGAFEVGLADGTAFAFVEEGGDSFSGVDQGAIELFAD